MAGTQFRQSMNAILG